jgi:hypothetical protein
MKKIVSNVLIVSTQLIIGGLFLFMLFSDNNEDNKVVVVENDNLNKMADAVSELFVADQMEAVVDESVEVDLMTEEEKKAKEEAEAKEKAEEEAKKKAAEEAEAARVAAEKAASEEAARNAVTVSASGYLSKPGAGFNVTTGNRTYSLSESDIVTVAKVVSCEAAQDKNDALAVMSVILNRADSYGTDPVSVVSARGQFSCYYHNYGSTSMISVVRDGLNGIRNNNYYSFGSSTSGMSSNYIVSNGNRYY